jgi:anti-sigma B factor antagonist
MGGEMKFKDKIHGDVGVITLKGKLMGLPETGELQDEVKAMFGQKISKIVLDLENVTWMNSIGIGAIMHSYTSVLNHGGNLCLAQVGGKVQSVLMLTKLATIFKTYETVNEAIESFK